MYMAFKVAKSVSVKKHASTKECTTSLFKEKKASTSNGRDHVLRNRFAFRRARTCAQFCWQPLKKYLISFL
jgi:hypothetical protein